MASLVASIGHPPAPIVPNWAAFCEWAKEGGYDESYFNRWDSKSLALQAQYLEELGAGDEA